jgi:hypothetical protein
MKRIVMILGVVFGLCVAGVSAAGQTAQKPAIFITPTGDGFEVYVAAAIMKKDVPARLVDNAEFASYTLRAAQIDIQKERTGSKVVKCLHARCAAIEEVQLVDQTGTVRWSYAVNKGRGAKNRQSMAEAIAEHLKSEYFHQ